jgi:hypothetical protein
VSISDRIQSFIDASNFGNGFCAGSLIQAGAGAN